MGYKIFSSEKQNSNIGGILVAVIALIALALTVPIDKMGRDMEKELDSQLWNPWISLRSSQVRSVILEPVYAVGYITISDAAIISDRKLISDLKENLGRKYMTEADKPGYHWASRRRIRLKADTESGIFSFILFFSDQFQSIEYQRTDPDGNKSSGIGSGWRSAELCRILGNYIENNKNIKWIDAGTIKKMSKRK